ncbi:hypothetical protein D9M69_718590 [compost metagenome]
MIVARTQRELGIGHNGSRVRRRRRLREIAPERPRQAWHIAKPPIDVVAALERHPGDVAHAPGEAIGLDCFSLDDAGVAIACFPSGCLAIQQHHLVPVLLQCKRG